MKVLELFAGSRSVGQVAEERGHEVFSLDIHPFDGIDLAKDILDTEPEDIPFVPDMIWASPPCTFFSVASIGHHWNRDHTPKSENAMLGVEIALKTFAIIDHFERLNPEMKWFVENPQGKLKKLADVVGDRIAMAVVWYCTYGDTRAKPTNIWSNHIRGLFAPAGWMPRPVCWNGNEACAHESAPRGSKTGTQGLKGSYDRSKIPAELVCEIIESVELAQMI